MIQSSIHLSIKKIVVFFRRRTEFASDLSCFRETKLKRLVRYSLINKLNRRMDRIFETRTRMLLSIGADCAYHTITTIYISKEATRTIWVTCMLSKFRGSLIGHKKHYNDGDSFMYVYDKPRFYVIIIIIIFVF